jgi:MoaD family protein
MATVKVRMFATVREAAGAAEVELAASTIKGLLKALVREFGDGMAQALSGAEQGSDGLVILVNGRNVQLTRSRDILLKDGDDVALFPPVSGG